MNSERHLHIVSFAIPYPPDYGGSIDIYFRIKSLYQCGIKIHLHCYDYLGEKHRDLEELCYSIHYYQRKMDVIRHLSLQPFIVSSRINKQLVENLQKFDAPVILEGLHTAFILKYDSLKHRKVMVRAHNIEHVYYQILGSLEKKPWKKIYFWLEAIRLKKFESILHQATKIAAISSSDYSYFQSKYGNTVYVPASHPFSNIVSREGFGEYIIFHGNLSVKENNDLAEWIICQIAPHIDFPFVITGKNPSGHLVKLSRTVPNVRIISNPNQDEMDQLIQNAHINLLPLFKTSGLKLKLLFALFTGRHCLVNNIMTEGSELEELCNIANSPSEMVDAIKELINRPFTNEMIEKRRKILTEKYNNLQNARKLLEYLY